MRFFSRFAIATAVSVSGLANAADFSAADAQFSIRGEQSFAEVTETRNVYAAMLPDLTGEELNYAVIQIARLDYYRGQGIDGVSDEQRRDVFSDCLNALDQLNDGSQSYYYYKTTCTALRGKFAANLADRARWGLSLKSFQDAALDATRNGAGALEGGFEAGGILRAMAAVRSNFKAQSLGLFDAAEAVRFSELALDAEGDVYAPYPELLTGRDYYENYFYLGQSQAALASVTSDADMLTTAIDTLTSAVEELEVLRDDDELPLGREPETLTALKTMQSLSTSLSSCVDSSEMAACIKEAIENQ